MRISRQKFLFFISVTLVLLVLLTNFDLIIDHRDMKVDRISLERVTFEKVRNTTTNVQSFNVNSETTLNSIGALLDEVILHKTSQRPVISINDSENSDTIISKIVSNSTFVLTNRSSRVKKIELIDTFEWWEFNATVLEHYCPNFSIKCHFLDGNHGRSEGIDAVVAVRDMFHQNTIDVRENVTRIFYIMESASYSKATLDRSTDLLASFWRGSDIVTPYNNWVSYNQSVRNVSQRINYAKGKSKMVAMFNSHCQTRNNRLEYVKELQKYITVDIFGVCGNFTCSKSNKSNCFSILKNHYKFYLSFENSNCRDYITEKFYVNALMNDVVPIVMGAHPDDYLAVAPQNSYIHVDNFENPEELAKYLLYLHRHDDKYNKYFDWKGTGEIIERNFLCRLCQFLHDKDTWPRTFRTDKLEWRSENKNLCLPTGETYWGRRS